MQTSETEGVEPANLRFLRRLVTVLTVVMIGGVLVVIALLVTRLNAPAPVLPETLILPEGAQAQAVTQGSDWVGVVTDRDQFLVYDRLTGKLRQVVTLETATE